MKVLPWGPHTWKALHYVALGYPDNPGPQDVENYRTFFGVLGYTLPCKMCTGHYYEHLKNLPIDLTSREALFAWTVNLHNTVNRSLGKRELTVDEAKAILFSDPGGGAEDDTKDVKVSKWWQTQTLMGVIIVLIATILIATAVFAWRCSSTSSTASLGGGGGGFRMRLKKP